MRIAYTLACLVGLLLPAAVLPAEGGNPLGESAGFAGKFSDGKLTVELDSGNGSCTGTFTLVDKTFPARATANGQSLDGSFDDAGKSFPFKASLDDNTLTITTAGKIYALKRVNPVTNPLAQNAPAAVGSAPASPLPAGAPVTNGALAGYTVAVSNDSGKSLLVQKPNIASVQAALEAVLPDLAGYFRQRPAVGSAYQSSKDPNSGGATFSSSLDGHAIRGIISVKLQGGGAKVGIIFGRADGPKSDWEKLMTGPAEQADSAAPAGGEQDGGAAPANIALTEHDYADGTGSIGLPEGWTTQAQSAVDGVAVKGPANQLLIVHNSVTVQTPDAPMVLAQQRSDAQLAQMNQRSAERHLPPITPKPLPPMLVAPPAGPIEAVQVLIPQFSKRSAFYNGPTSTFGKFISTKELPIKMPNAKLAIVDFTLTQTLNGQSTAMRIEAKITTVPIANTAWMYLAHYSAAAPEATFDHDLPILMAIVKSEKIDLQKLGQIALARNQQQFKAGQEMIAANNAQAQAINNMYKQNAQTQQDIHDAQQAQTQAGYDAHNAQFKTDQLQRSRSAADFNESIIGTRTIYDTVTGQSGYAKLTDVNGVVDSLNQAALDPNRFVQIPLRDQLYPLPPGK